jgi:hypothetical protein
MSGEFVELHGLEGNEPVYKRKPYNLSYTMLRTNTVIKKLSELHLTFFIF